MPFTSLGLSPMLVRALGDLGYTAATDIQQSAIPAMLQGRDVLATAQTGSGKTAAFGLALLQKWMQEAEPHSARLRRTDALVLVPTRELAVQVAQALIALARHLPRLPKVAALFGGVSVNPQMMGLRGGADIVVATPGRLLDLLERRALDVGFVRTLVLDEADRLMALGFEQELARILTLLPGTRQSLLFSATFPLQLAELAARNLREPIRLELARASQSLLDIVERAVEVDPPRRTQLLRRMIEIEKWSRVLVFVATKHAAEIVADKLRKTGLQAEPFHAELTQGKRSQVLRDFKTGAIQIVVATDVAARGLDIAELPVVVNYDLPRSPDDYTHRVGRTGRAGASGVAVSFISHATEGHFRLIEKRRACEVSREQIPGFERTEPPGESAIRHSPDSNGGIKGNRPSKKDKLRAAAAAGSTKIN